jgi:hypothetical protein
MQGSLPAGGLAFTGRELNPLDRYKRFQTTHSPLLDLSNHKRHGELLEWCGGNFDAQQLNITEINRSLASLALRKNTRRKTAKPTAHK